MTSWHSYPSIFNLSHRAVEELLFDSVLVEEKIDGSQFSFGLFEDGFRARSKAAMLNVIAPEKMFQRAVDVAHSLPLHEGWTYRAEYLQKPKHNSLAYDRIPKNHLILFDINSDEEAYLNYQDKATEADRIGLEIVPHVFSGRIESAEQFRAMLDATSILGGQKIEGVVIKNYHRFGPDKKVLMGKFVSEAFKEVHAREWKLSNPAGKDVIQTLVESLRTPARWNKAVQHLRERGLIEDSPRDIGHLIKEAQADIEKECADEIKEALFKWAFPQVRRGVTAGIAEWYKDELVKLQFNRAENE